MAELARRSDSRVAGLCRAMLRSENTDDWFAAVRVLRVLGTEDAADLLLNQCQVLDSVHRRIVLNQLAHILPPHRAKTFSELLQMVEVGGTLDVTDWADVAFLSLMDFARENGVKVVLSFNNSVEPSSLPSYVKSQPAEEKAVHLSTEHKS